MKLLKIILKNTKFFSQNFEISFMTKDRVRKLSSDNTNTMQAYKIRNGLYTQILLSLIGLNATGKTTVLETISAILKILIEHRSLKDITPLLNKLSSQTESKQIHWIIYFLNQENNESFIYRLESIITFDKKTQTFIYKDEYLSKKRLKDSKNINICDLDITTNQTIDRKKEQNPYLKKDMSIAMSLNECPEKLYPLETTVNLNVPYWIGQPSKELIACFDPNVEELSISDNNNSLQNESEVTLKFKNEKNNYTANRKGLMDLLSSGTIKGLSIIPAIVDALRHGGYVIIDEMENHFNKKIVEWFLSLFADKRTNPHGACLIFSTHYPEILDSFARKDNIYIMRRDTQGKLENIRYSDKINRNELSKSNIILSNVITGTAPRYQDLKLAKNYLSTIIQERKVE